jgi:hypothetical protein
MRDIFSIFSLSVLTTVAGLEPHPILKRRGVYHFATAASQSIIDFVFLSTEIVLYHQNILQDFFKIHFLPLGTSSSGWTRTLHPILKRRAVYHFATADSQSSIEFVFDFFLINRNSSISSKILRLFYPFSPSRYLQQWLDSNPPPDDEKASGLALCYCSQSIYYRIFLYGQK